MKRCSTNAAARKLGISPASLSRYISSGKLPPPSVVEVGTASLHLWTEAEIERARKLLPTIADGRKTRYQKKKSAVSKKQSGKAQKKKTKRGK